MPTVDDLEVDFDSMSDEDLEKYLAELREVSKSRKPRAGASAKPVGSSTPKAPRAKKAGVPVIQVKLD